MDGISRVKSGCQLHFLTQDVDNELKLLLNLSMRLEIYVLSKFELKLLLS